MKPLIDVIKKNKIVIFGLFLIILSLAIYGFQNMLIRTNLTRYWADEDASYELFNHQVVRCNYNLFSPNVAFLSEIKYKDFDNEFNIFFYNIDGWLSNSISSTGATAIKNTTYSEVLNMLRDDCDQFKKRYYTSEDEIHWGYSRVETKDEQEAYEDRIEQRRKAREEAFEKSWELATEEERAAYLKEKERFDNRSEEERWADLGLSEDDIDHLKNSDWKTIQIK